MDTISNTKLLNRYLDKLYISGEDSILVNPLKKFDNADTFDSEMLDIIKEWLEKSGIKYEYIFLLSKKKN